MAQRTIKVTAQQAGFDLFTRRDCRAMVGRKYPITDVHGKLVGEGEIRSARTLDPEQRVLVLVIEAPLHLAVAMDTDTGSMGPQIEVAMRRSR